MVAAVKHVCVDNYLSQTKELFAQTITHHFTFSVSSTLSQWIMERWNMAVRCIYLEIDRVAMVIIDNYHPDYKTVLKGNYLGFKCCHSDL